MPFTMTHLCIAHEILSSTPQIKKPCDFILGAIAPDAIHFRENYISDMKKTTHLCVGDERWGLISNNKEWMENVLDFLQKNKQQDNTDFIYGYCSHILADIQNNIKIWTPFRIENEIALKNGAGSIYHQESRAIDYEIYLSCSQQAEIWSMLEKAASFDIPDIISASEIDKMREDILYCQYQGRETSDTSLNKYVSLDIAQSFIADESQYIKELLGQNGF